MFTDKIADVEIFGWWFYSCKQSDFSLTFRKQKLFWIAVIYSRTKNCSKTISPIWLCKITSEIVKQVLWCGVNTV